MSATMCPSCHHFPSGRTVEGQGHCQCDCHDVADAAPDLLATLKGLVAKIDQVAIDTRLGDETDRVFAHYEFDEARAAIAKAERK